MQRDPGPERSQRHVHDPRGVADVLLDEQQTAGRGLRREESEVVLAEHPLAHEAEQEPQLARRDPAVGERHGRLRDTAALGQHLVQELALEPPDEPGERRCVRPDPGRPVHDRDSVDNPRQVRPEMLGQRRHDLGHRGRIVALGRPELVSGEGAGCGPQARDRDVLDPSPVHEPRGARGALDLAAGHGHGGPQHGAHEEPDLPQALLRDPPATSRIRTRRRRHQPAVPRSMDSTSGKDSPNIRDAIDRKRSTSPVVSCTWIGGGP